MSTAKTPTLFDYDQSLPYSYSMIALYESCPFRYKLAYLDKVTASKKQRFYIIVGSTLHLVLQDFFSLKVDQRTVKNIIDLLDKRWNRWNSDKDKDQYLRQCEEILARFCQSFPVDTEVFALEHGFKVAFGESLLKGKIDRIDRMKNGTYEIIDYKLGDATAKNIDHIKSNLQWIFYWHAFKKLYPMYKPSTVSFYFLEATQKVSFQPTAGDEEQALARLKQQIETIKSDTLFIKKTSRDCNNCYFLGSECRE